MDVLWYCVILCIVSPVSNGPIPKFFGSDDIANMGSGHNNQVSRDKVDFHMSLFDDESMHNSYGQRDDPHTPWYIVLAATLVALGIFYCCIHTGIYCQIDFSICSRLGGGQGKANGQISAQDQVTLREIEDAQDERRHIWAMELEKEKLKAAQAAQAPPGYREAAGYMASPNIYPNLGHYAQPTAPQAGPSHDTAPQVPKATGERQGNVTLFMVNSAECNKEKECVKGKGLAALDPDSIWPDIVDDKGKESAGEALAKGIREALQNINRS